MKITTITILFFLISSYQPLSAQWQAGIKNIRLGASNTQLFLHFSNENNNQTYTGEITFREKISHHIQHRKELIHRPGAQEVVTYSFQLPSGEYEVDIDLKGNVDNKHALKTMTYNCRFGDERTELSDIFLSYQPIVQINGQVPLLELVLLPERGEVNYYMEIYSSGIPELIADAILLMKKTQEFTEATHYESIEKNRTILNVLNGKARLSGSFDISALVAGEYLFQIIIDDGTGFKKYNSTSFTIEGGIRNRVFANIEESIQMMEYILPGQDIAHLLSIKNREVKMDSLEKVWHRLYPENGPESMENFYERIYTFLDSLSEVGEDWRSDRAKIYVQYGKPDQGSEGSGTFTYRNKAYLRWTYLNFDLSFTFEKRNNTYYLIE